MPRHSRHLQRVDARVRAGRLLTIGVTWVAGLVTGAYCLLAIFVRYGCGANDDGLACTSSGSAVGVVLVVGVIAVVTAVTALALNREPRPMLMFALVGLVLLGGFLLGARQLIHTA